LIGMNRPKGSHPSRSGTALCGSISPQQHARAEGSRSVVTDQSEYRDDYDGSRVA
jgi:hypothetical protein